MPEKLEYENLKQEAVDTLNKCFTYEFRSGYIKCKNFTFPERFQQFGDRIQNLEVRPDDIWICSFPKAGTTWTQEMVWCIANNVDLEAAQNSLSHRCPFLELSTLFDYDLISSKFPAIKLPVHVIDSITNIENKKSPRFIKTHLPFELLPNQLKGSQTTAKIIYIARNPRDTCVSYYHHAKLLEGYKGDFETFTNLFVQGDIAYGPFFEHVLGYWNRRHNGNILFNFYEDQKKDLKSFVLKTTAFLEKTLTEEQIDELLEHLSFEKMKLNRAVNKEPQVELHKQFNLVVEDGPFMRQGQVKTWTKYMTSTTIEKFTNWEEKYLENNNLVFPIV